MKSPTVYFIEMEDDSGGRALRGYYGRLRDARRYARNGLNEWVRSREWGDARRRVGAAYTITLEPGSGFLENGFVEMHRMDFNVGGKGQPGNPDREGSA